MLLLDVAPVVRYTVNSRIDDPTWKPSGPFTLPPNVMRFGKSWSTARRVAALYNLDAMKFSREGTVFRWAVFVANNASAGILVVYDKRGWVPKSPFDYPPQARASELTYSEFREKMTADNEGQFSRGWWTSRIRPIWRKSSQPDRPTPTQEEITQWLGGIDAALYGDC